MSKERELLEETLVVLEMVHMDECDLYFAIEELLAQPEQSNEPVAWRGVNFTEAEGIWLYRDLDEPFTDSNFKNVGEALYLAPQKQEPLRDESIAEQAVWAANSKHSFKEGVRWAEQQHGIGL